LKPHESPDPDAQPQRPTFTAEFKARILDEYDAAPDAADQPVHHRKTGA
jgi:transposase